MAFWDRALNRLNNYARTAVYNWLFRYNTPPTADEIEEGIQDMVTLARRYYDGNHTVYLTDRQRAWLELHGATVRFTVNHCQVVVDAVVERLKVVGFRASDDALSALLWGWWQAGRMDAVQTEAHRYSVRDGEAFILVSWDAEERRPTFTLHPRFVDIDRGGDGYGMWIEYPNNDYLSKPVRAFKQWRKTENNMTVSYRTVYYPDHIEKWRSDAGEWRQIEDPEPWTMPDGSPIGIPVAHLRNPGIKSELRDVVPLQDALNKAWLDILAAADSTGFRMLAFFGWIPTTDELEPKADGSNLLQVAPGQMFGTERPPSEASIYPIDPASPQPLMEIEDRIVIRIASVTSTPLSRFITSRQIAAEGTLQQQEGPLLAKVGERQTLFGNAWEDAMGMGVKLASVYGGMAAQKPEIDTIWAPSETRNDQAQIEIATKKKALGVPLDTVFTEIGYTPEQVERMKESPEWTARVANLDMARLSAESMRDENRS